MATSKLSTLVKSLDFFNEEEYFNYIVESNQNGQWKQTRELFKSMRLKDRVSFFQYLTHSVSNEIHNSILDTLTA